MSGLKFVAVATNLHVPRLGSLLPPERQCGVINPCRSVNTYCLLVVPEAAGRTRAGEVLSEPAGMLGAGWVGDFSAGNFIPFQQK